MKCFKNTKKIIFILSIFFVNLSYLCTYERDKSLEYVDSWWNSDLDDDGIREHINPLYDEFYNSGGDCANFGSQVLIAGGIWFGSDGVQKGGTIALAESLRTNLIIKHSAKKHSTLNGNIQRADIVFWTNHDTNPDADHTMEIRTRLTNNIYVSAHDTDRHGVNAEDDPYVFLSVYGTPVLAFLQIPDSPIIQQVLLIQNGDVKYHAYYNHSSNQKVININKLVGAGEIKLKVIFDTPMKTDSNQISFSKLPYTVKNFTPDGGTNGWTATFYSNDTWNGKYTIPANTGSEYDGENYISIFARGLDNSPIDSDEDLSAYDRNSTNPDTNHSFTIDTTPPEKWKGILDNVDKETNPGNLILAKEQGSSNFGHVYTCDALPETDGFYKIYFGGNPLISIVDGQLRIETHYRGSGDYDSVSYYKYLWNEPLCDTEDFTVEYKLNVERFTDYSNLWFRSAYYYGASKITYYWDDYSGYEVWLNNEILNFNFMGYHIYRLVFKKGGSLMTDTQIDYYIDGELKATYSADSGNGFEIACNENVTMLLDYFAYTQGAYAPNEKPVFRGGDYVSPGTYTSEIEDKGQIVNWDKISWVSECPAGTSVTWQTRTSSDNITWSDWSQEYTNSSGNDITSPDGRYIQKKAKLNTTDIAQTPILKDVNITYHTNEPPATPSNLTVTTYADRIDISWAPNPDSDIAGYNIYRAASPYIKINPILITTTYYSDTTVIYGINYKYAVTSVDEAGNESAFQDEPVSATLDILDILPCAAFGRDGIIVNGQGKIYGNIKSNKNIDLTGQTKIDGNAEAGTITIKGKSGITGTITQNAQPVNFNPIDLSILQEKISQNNDNNKIPLTNQGKEAIINGILTLTGQDTLTITTGTYYLQGINLSDQTKLNIQGKVEIFCTGKIDLTGHSKILDIFNTNAIIIYNISNQSIVMGGQTELRSIIYAPESSIIVSGQSIIMGNIFAKNIEITGQCVIIGEENKEQMKLYIAPELAPTTAFIKGEVYAFPNPAKGGYQPTIHVECGIADSVEIQIYNIACELVHKDEISTQPIIKNNKYAYEYTWDISNKASGVYIYLVRAHKNGENTIRVLKKIAILK